MMNLNFDTLLCHKTHNVNTHLLPNVLYEVKFDIYDLATLQQNEKRPPSLAAA